MREIECPNCGKVFNAAGTKQRFCCKECQIRYHARKKYEAPVATCVICGRKFEPKYRGQKYCSQVCHGDPAAQKLRVFFSAMFNWLNVDTSNLERVVSYGV